MASDWFNETWYAHPMTRYRVRPWVQTRLVRLYWYFFRPQTQGAKVVLLYGDEILVVRNSYGSRRWNLPGGGIERGETPEEAAIREVREELNIQLDVVEFLGSYQSQIEHKQDTIFCFVAKLSSKFFEIDHHELIEARWWPIAELPNSLSLSAKKSLEFLDNQSAQNR